MISFSVPMRERTPSFFVYLLHVGHRNPHGRREVPQLPHAAFIIVWQRTLRTEKGPT